MSGSMGKVLFKNTAGDRQDVVSGLVQLLILFRRLHACAAGAVYDANFPISRTIRALHLRRDLAQLEVLRVTHAGDQLFRLFAEQIEFLSLVQIHYERVTVRVILELLNQSFYDLLAIRVFFLDCWVRFSLFSVINITATSFLILRSVVFFEMLATSFFVLRVLFALMVGGCSRFGIRKILTSMMQIRREYGSR